MNKEDIIAKLNVAKFAKDPRDRIAILDEVIKEIVAKDLQIEEDLHAPEKPKKTGRPRKKGIEVPKDPTIKDK